MRSEPNNTHIPWVHSFNREKFLVYFNLGSWRHGWASKRINIRWRRTWRLSEGCSHPSIHFHKELQTQYEDSKGRFKIRNTLPTRENPSNRMTCSAMNILNNGISWPAKLWKCKLLTRFPKEPLERAGSYPNSAITILIILQIQPLWIQTRVVITSQLRVSNITSTVSRWNCARLSEVALAIANVNPQPNFPGTGGAKNLTLHPNSQGQGFEELTLQRGVDRLQRHHRGPETSRRRAFANNVTTIPRVIIRWR